MSAKKRAIVRLEKQEYQELKKLEKKHIKQKTAVEWKEADVAVSYVEENLQAMKERQDNYRQLVDSLTTDLTQMEFATQDALISQENHFVDQLNFMEIEISRNAEQLIQQQNETFNYLIHTVDQSYQEEIQHLNQKMQYILSNQRDKDQYAIELIEGTDQFFEWMRTNYDWDFFFPDDLVSFERRIDSANDSYYMGMAEAAVAQIQEIKNDLQKTRLELEKKQSEWALLRGMIDQRITKFLEIIEENRYVLPVDLKMNVIEDVDLLDVNYWSQDRLVELEEKLLQMKSRIQNEKCDVLTDDLKKWLSLIGENIEEKLASTIMFARYNALDAQIRRNLATIAADVMAANGFQVVNYDDDINGIQEPFFVLMQDDHGGQVSIGVTPEEGYINNISIELSESTPVMDYQIENQRREVIGELNRRGVAVERIDTPQHVIAEDSQSYGNFKETSSTILPQKQHIIRRKKQ
jgi:KaiC/GvpD/RAD55 family RecA-like ATPase